jgi:hypothetical protein
VNRECLCTQEKTFTNDRQFPLYGYVTPQSPDAGSTPFFDKVCELLAEFFDQIINHKTWHESGTKILLDSALRCTSFMALRFYWDENKGIGVLEATTFFQYIHLNYGIASWMIYVALFLVIWVIATRVMAHRFE